MRIEVTNRGAVRLELPGQHPMVFDHKAAVELAQKMTAASQSAGSVVEAIEEIGGTVVAEEVQAKGSPTFIPGDVVQLKSGGLRMTVIGVRCCGIVTCIFAPEGQPIPFTDDVYDPLPQQDFSPGLLMHAGDDFPF